MNDFLASAASRETSPELMAAIYFAAGHDEAAADAIWADGPTDAELVCIIERVTKNGLYETTEFCWGANGTRWASAV